MIKLVAMSDPPDAKAEDGPNAETAEQTPAEKDFDIPLLGFREPPTPRDEQQDQIDGQIDDDVAGPQRRNAGTAA